MTPQGSVRGAQRYSPVAVYTVSSWLPPVLHAVVRGEASDDFNDSNWRYSCSIPFVARTYEPPVMDERRGDNESVSVIKT